MTSTSKIAIYAVIFVASISLFAFIYPTLSRPDLSLIISVDAELNGIADDYNHEYRPISSDENNIINEIFALRIANLGKVDANNISINLKFEPTNDWYSVISVEQTFGPPVIISDDNVIVEQLSVDETVTIKYVVSMNATSIGSNNLLQRKSHINFVVESDDSPLISENLFNVRLPSS